MITQNILNVIGRTIIGVIQLIPALPAEVASSVQTAVGYLGVISTKVAMFGVIVPFSQMWTGAKIWLACWLAAAVIYVARFLISVVTGGGGAK